MCASLASEKYTCCIALSMSKYLARTNHELVFMICQNFDDNSKISIKKYTSQRVRHIQYAQKLHYNYSRSFWLREANCLVKGHYCGAFNVFVLHAPPPPLEKIGTHVQTQRSRRTGLADPILPDFTPLRDGRAGKIFHRISRLPT